MPFAIIDGDKKGGPMIEDLLNEQFVHIDVECSNKEELLSQMAKVLIKENYVKESFEAAIITRENVYPTGLVTKSVPVAIPHTDRNHVNKSVISVATLKQPVGFKAMGMIDEPVDVEMVFMLAIDSNDGQVEMLQKLMGIMVQEELLTALKESKDSKKTLELLRKELAV